MTHLRATEWTVAPISDHGTATRLIRLWHYAQGAPNTSTYRHGLWPGPDPWGDPVGIALWLPPTRPAAEAVAGERWRGVLTLSRLVIAPHVPTNGASFLLGRSMKLINRKRWPVLLTYADTSQGHTGAIYRATNWRCDGPVPAGDTWTDRNGKQAGRKRGGRTLTVEQMSAAGYTRKPPAPKIRFVHDAEVPA